MSSFYSWWYSFGLCFFFFNDTATTEIYTLSLHDALPIWAKSAPEDYHGSGVGWIRIVVLDRKSTRLNSSHANISYAVFCLKKKQHNNLAVHFPAYRNVMIFTDLLHSTC